MSDRLLIIKNARWAAPGRFGDVLEARGIPSDVIELDAGDRIPDVRGYRGVMLFGGCASANDSTDEMTHQRQRVTEILEAGIPFLGVCLGLQVLVKVAGGLVTEAPEMEVGFFDGGGRPYTLQVTEAGRRDPLLAGMPDEFHVFQSHGDEVHLEPGMELLARATSGTRNQIVRVGARAYGVQMHIEIGPRMLEEWAAVDPHLQGRDMAELRAEMAAVGPGMSANAERIAGNFLAIAGLALEGSAA